ncbi:MAG: hypothetical protein GY863_00095, partial [bacterium]|nr:hypothetical protein [bacterium]
MKHRFVSIIILNVFLLFLSGCAEKTAVPELEGPYLGQEPPGMTPELFAPGIVSTGNTDWTTAFTPDGNEAYYTTALLDYNVLVHIWTENGVWQEPELPSFADARYHFADPFVSPDGKRLYFWSNRPVEPSGEPRNNSDLWYVDLLENNTYGQPVRIDEIINTTDWQVFPTVSSNGNLYFSGYYADNTKGRFDVYMSELVDGKYTK